MLQDAANGSNFRRGLVSLLSRYAPAAQIFAANCCSCCLTWCGEWDAAVSGQYGRQQRQSRIRILKAVTEYLSPLPELPCRNFSPFSLSSCYISLLSPLLASSFSVRLRPVRRCRVQTSHCVVFRPSHSPGSRSPIDSELYHHLGDSRRFDIRRSTSSVSAGSSIQSGAPLLLCDGTTHRPRTLLSSCGVYREGRSLLISFRSHRKQNGRKQEDK